MTKLTVDILKEMVRKSVSEQLNVPQPKSPILSPPADTGASLLSKAQKSLADNEALRAEIKAEMDANPKDARVLKMALQDVAAAILANKEVIATLAKKQSGGLPVEEQAYAAPSVATEQPETSLGRATPHGENLKSVLDGIKKAGFSWKPAPDGMKALLFWEGKQFAAITRQSSRWIIRYQSAVEGVLKLIVRTLEEVKEWLVDEIAMMIGMTEPEEPTLSEDARISSGEYRTDDPETDEERRERQWQASPAAQQVARQKSDIAKHERERLALQKTEKAAREKRAQGYAADTARDKASIEADYEAEVARQDKERAQRNWKKKHPFRSLFGVPKELAEQPLDVAEPQEDDELYADVSQWDAEEYEDDNWRDLEDVDFSEPTPSSGAGWTLSPDPDQTDVPMSDDDESGEDMSWWNTDVEPGEELPKQMGMGKAGKLRAEGRGSAWSRWHARDPEDADLFSPEFDTEAEFRRERQKDHPDEDDDLDLIDYDAPLPTRRAVPQKTESIDEKCVSEALEWVRNDDPDKVRIYEAWVQREVREASGRGGTLDDSQYAEIAEEFLSDMTDRNPEYQKMLKEERTEVSGMTRVESKAFAGMDKVALGKVIVKLVT